MKILTINSFFKYFIYNRDSDFLNESEKKIASVASKILSIFGLPRLCRHIWAGCKIWTFTEKQEITRRVQSAIRKAIPPQVTHANWVCSQKISCHSIVEGLHLGNSYGFIQTTHYPFVNQKSRKVLANTNPEGFKTVITMCPKMAIDADFEEFGQIDTALTESFFKHHGVEWVYPGRAIADAEHRWLPLVHDCTFLTSSLACQEIDTDAEKNESLFEKKTEVMQNCPVTKWFEPLFEKIDAAIFENKKILVHCQAGVSRSASLLAAYLISRFDVTAEEAINYLKSKRLCVKPKFLNGLKEYALDIKAARV